MRQASLTFINAFNFHKKKIERSYYLTHPECFLSLKLARLFI